MIKGLQGRLKVNGRAILVFDAGCPFCTSIAERIRNSSKEKIQPLALQSPQAAFMLRKFYPLGWKKNFYLISQDMNYCAHGLRAAYYLLLMLNLKTFVRIAFSVIKFKTFNLLRWHLGTRVSNNFNQIGNGKGECCNNDVKPVIEPVKEPNHVRRLLLKTLGATTVLTVTAKALPFYQDAQAADKKGTECFEPPRWEVLKGQEANRVMSEALSNQYVKRIVDSLIEEGFHPRYDEGRAVAVWNGNGTKGTVAVLPLNSGERKASIIYLKDNLAGELIYGGIQQNLGHNPPYKVSFTLLGFNNAGELLRVGPIEIDVESNGGSHLCDDFFCRLYCGVACAVGCGAGAAILCAIACTPFCVGCAKIWTCPACFACVLTCGGLMGAICYIIGIYGCDPGCRFICCKVGH